MLSAVGMTIGTDPVAFSILEVPPSNISVLMRSPPNADDEELLSGDETRRDLHKKPVPGFKNSQTLPPAGKYGKGVTGQREMSGTPSDDARRRGWSGGGPLLEKKNSDRKSEPSYNMGNFGSAARFDSPQFSDNACGASVSKKPPA